MTGDIIDQAILDSYYTAYAYLGYGTRDNNLYPTKPDYGYHAFNPRFYWTPYICEIYG